MDSQKQSPNKVRLQKYLAACGVASRRASEALIDSGRVTVNGAVVARQGFCIDPAVDAVAVDSRRVQPEKKIHILLNKPRGVVSTSRDPQGRGTFLDCLPDQGFRLYSVGRLDYDTEGMLIVTNDGALAHSLAHPRHEVEKVYEAWTLNALSPEQISMLKQGVESRGELLRAVDVRAAGRDGRWHCFRVVLKEGRNRQIRRMFEALGLEVGLLRRVKIGGLELGPLKPGSWRRLEDGEVARLLHSSARRP